MPSHFLHILHAFDIHDCHKSNIILIVSFRTVRSDASLVPPIRQTASIFKQPVTLVKNQEGKVKSDNPKHGSQEKPKQLFWEKRLEVCEFELKSLRGVFLTKFPYFRTFKLVIAKVVNSRWWICRHISNPSVQRFKIKRFSNLSRRLFTHHCIR